MAIDWSHLPNEVKEKICFCSRSHRGGGWRLNPETGWWVHPKCGKPTLPAAVFECDICDKAFVPKNFPEHQFMGVICDECTA